MLRIGSDEITIPKAHLDEDHDELTDLVKLNDKEEQIVKDMLDEDSLVKTSKLLRHADIYDILEIDGHRIYISNDGFMYWTWMIPDLDMKGEAHSGAEAKAAAFKAIGYDPFEEIN